MSTSLADLIAQRANGLATARMSEIEQCLLAGSNRLVVDDVFAGRVVGRTIFEVPRWRQHPVKRLQVERLRRQARRRRFRER